MQELAEDFTHAVQRPLLYQRRGGTLAVRGTYLYLQEQQIEAVEKKKSLISTEQVRDERW